MGQNINVGISNPGKGEAYPGARARQQGRVKVGPAAKAARGRVQTFWNKASHRMETAQQMHHYQRPVPPGHKVTGTKTVTKTEGAPAAPPAGGKSLLEMTPGEIDARANQIVNAEIKAERLPFQQRNTLLGQEQQGVMGAHAANYAQEQGTLAGLATKAADSAKTYTNQAADAVAKAQQAAPGAAQAAEHGVGTSESSQREQAAAKALLTQLATASQTGTQARQQSEADYLTNVQATAAQNATGVGQQIQGEYGKRKAENMNEEGRIIARKAGAAGKLGLELQGEQAKLNLARETAGLNKAKVEISAAKTKADIGAKRAAADLANKSYNLAVKKNQADEEYKKAGSGNKKLKDELDIKKKEIDIKKALTSHPGGLTTQEANAYSSEASVVFNKYRAMRAEGISPKDIREALLRGYIIRTKVNNKGEPVDKKGKSIKKAVEEGKNVPITYKEPLGGEGVKNPVWVDAAEQIMQKRYISAATKQQLREMKLPDSGWSNRFLSGTAGSQNQAKGVKGSG